MPSDKPSPNKNSNPTKTVLPTPIENNKPTSPPTPITDRCKDNPTAVCPKNELTCEEIGELGETKLQSSCDKCSSTCPITCGIQADNRYLQAGCVDPCKDNPFTVCPLKFGGELRCKTIGDMKGPILQESCDECSSYCPITCGIKEGCKIRCKDDLNDICRLESGDKLTCDTIKEMTKEDQQETCNECRPTCPFTCGDSEDTFSCKPDDTCKEEELNCEKLDKWFSINKKDKFNKCCETGGYDSCPVTCTKTKEECPNPSGKGKSSKSSKSSSGKGKGSKSYYESKSPGKGSKSSYYESKSPSGKGKESKCSKSSGKGGSKPSGKGGSGKGGSKTSGKGGSKTSGKGGSKTRSCDDYFFCRLLDDEDARIESCKRDQVKEWCPEKCDLCSDNSNIDGRTTKSPKSGKLGSSDYYVPSDRKKLPEPEIDNTRTKIAAASKQTSSASSKYACAKSIIPSLTIVIIHYIF